MTFNRFKQRLQNLLFLVFIGLLPVVGLSANEDIIHEKRIRVAMRTIGHEVLTSLGDSVSRVMPIERFEEHYKIPFEFQFGFDPDSIITIVDRVMSETKISSAYLVEVEQCESKQIVHSFEIGIPTNKETNVCKGRVLPKDCYSLLITLLDEDSSIELNAYAFGSSSKGPFFKADSEGLLMPTILGIMALLIIGLFAFFIKKRNQKETDPNLIIIGASKFDKRNMALSFNNTRIDLSNKEAELLSLLHTSANSPIEREVILRRVWGDDGDYVGRTLDVFISKLRKKLEADTSVKIINIRGVGYKLVMDTSA